MKLPTLVMVAAAPLLLVACGSEADEPVEPDETPMAAEEEPEIDLSPRVIGETIAFGGLEYTIGEVIIVDLDEQNDTVDQRVQGLEVTVEAEAHNPTDSSRGIDLPHALVWTDPGGAQHEVGGTSGSSAGVPSGSAAAFELTFMVTAEQAQTFDPDVAVIRFGREGAHAPQVPLGSEGELLTKLPHHQGELIGVAIDFGGITWTIDEAFIGYDHANSRLNDDEVLLEIAYTFTNHSDSQQCHRRGAGNNFSITHTETGLGAVDLGTERCVAAGSEEQWRTGFLLPADSFAGPHTLTGHHTVEHAREANEEWSVEVDVTIIDNPLAVSQWP